MGHNRKRHEGRQSNVPRSHTPSARWIFTPPSEFYFALVLFLAGSVLFWHTESNYTNNDPRKDHWTQILGNISEKRIEKRPCFGSRNFLIYGNYAVSFSVPYSVGGQEYLAKWGPYCARTQEDAEKMIVEKQTDAGIMVYVNPENPDKSTIHLDGPWQLWLGRIIALILLIVSIPKAVLVPLLNLRTYLRSEERTKGPIALFLSLFPIRYKARLSRAVRQALAVVPTGELSISHSQCDVSPGISGRFVKDENGKLLADRDLSHHLMNFDSTPPLLFVPFFVPDDATRESSALTEWEGSFVKALHRALQISSFPNAAIKHVRVVFHSREEIRRVGEYDYWK